jgi:hypothetical protein
MLDKQQSTETSQERRAEPGSQKQPETILKKLRYPDQSEYRVKYKDGKRVVTKEDDGG